MFLFLSLITVAIAHQCIHDQIQNSVKVQVADQKFAWPDADRKKQISQVPAEPLRIHFDTSHIGVGRKTCKGQETVTVQNVNFQCEERYHVSPEMKQRIEGIINRVQEEISKIFRILRNEGGVSMPDWYKGRWCFENEISIDKYLINSPERPQMDMLIQVTAWPTQGTTLAWAGACLTNQFGRPIAGHINFGPQAVSASTDDSLFATALHEVFHALGFTKSRHEKFIDAAGNVLKNNTATVRIGSESQPKDVRYLTSPAVVAAAREFYNCPTLTGMELEDYQGSFSHWDERISGNEVMSPTQRGKETLRISPMTLAYFQDMGVYTTDMKYAAHFSHGKGAGCDFLTQPPSAFSVERSLRCPVETAPGNRCSPYLDGYSSCGWFNYGDEGSCLAAFSRQDDANCRRGGNRYADYLTTASAFINCNNAETLSVSGSSYGAEASRDSRCMMTNVIKHGWRRNGKSASCYRVECPAVTPVMPEPVVVPPTAPEPEPEQPVEKASADECWAIRDCDTCKSRSDCGTWCDHGWRSEGTRSGYCSNGLSPCDFDLTERAQCYPGCTNSANVDGECRNAATCSGNREQGSCAGVPDGVMCCTEPNKKRKRQEAQNQERAKLWIDGAAHECPREGGQISISTENLKGDIDCPTIEDLCCVSNNGCSGNGQCLNGACACVQGWVGLACDQQSPSPVTQMASRVGWTTRNFALEDEEQVLDIFVPSEDEPREPEVVQGDLAVQPNDFFGLTGWEVVAALLGVIVIAALAIGSCVATYFYLKKRNNLSHV